MRNTTPKASSLSRHRSFLLMPTICSLPSQPDLRNHGGMPAPENITLRITVIAGQRSAVDYALMWRGMSVGRILLGNGAPHGRPQWTWSCHVHGRPQGSDDRGTGADIDAAN
jgi:hypothetical protein